MTAGWHAIEQAAAGPSRPRWPFHLGPDEVGSVEAGHAAALQGLSAHLRVEPGRVRLDAPPHAVDAEFAQMNDRLRARGLIVAWRDEPYPVVHPLTGRRLARIERASSRFWGTLTFGAHATGYLPDAEGRPAAVWIARRSPHKAIDPGMLDNLIGGGVPDGQTPEETLVREGWEEAGLRPVQLSAARPGRLIRLARDIPEGFQHERLSSFDLALPSGLTPVNQDGEVAGFQLLEPQEALARAAAGEMTVDATLVMLDFALRHRLLPAVQAEALARRAAPLWLGA